MTRFKFWRTHPSQEWLKLELSNFVHREIKSRDDKSAPKMGGYVHVTHFCMFNCRPRKFLPHLSVLLTEISNAVDGGSVSRTLDGRRYTLRLKLHRINLSLYLLQTWLYNIDIDNKSTKWSLSIIVQMCANNQHFSVCITIRYRQTFIAW